MKVLITGANGYIGSRVVKELCDANLDVVACDIKANNIDKRAKIILFNLLEKTSIDLFRFFGEPDICLHLAWRDGFVHFSENHIKDISSHFEFLLNLVSNGLKKLCIMGTMHEVGYYEGAITENTICNPTNYYGISKNSLRLASKILCEKFNCQWKWLRAFYIFGNDDSGNSVLSKIKIAANEGKKDFLLTKGLNKFDFIEISQLCRLICAIICQDSVNGIINVCSGNPITLKEKIIEFVESNNLKINLKRGAYPERESESPCIYGDTSKLKQALKEYEKIKKRG